MSCFASSPRAQDSRIDWAPEEELATRFRIPVPCHRSRCTCSSPAVGAAEASRHDYLRCDPCMPSGAVASTGQLITRTRSRAGTSARRVTQY